jgi:hypothetical protein
LFEEARRTWEQAETERVEHEQLLAEKVEAEKLAEERSQLLLEAVGNAESERKELEAVVAAKTAAVHQAAEKVAAARRAREEAESERVEIERIFAEEEMKVAVSAEQPEEAELVAVQVVEMLQPLEEKFKTGEPPALEVAPATVVLSSGERVLQERLEQEEVNPVTDQSVKGKTTQAEKPVIRWLPDPGGAGTSVVKQTLGAQSSAERIAPKEGSPFYNPFDSEPEVIFAKDESRECIEVGKETILRELYCSSNLARVTMESYPAQNCVAFLSSIEKNGDFLVYVAFFLGESDKVLVYTPSKQPGTVTECEDITREGIRFIETVGLIMDHVDTGGENDLEKLMELIPALRRVLLCKP